ncbi:hypothetical protein OUZ56_014589 [Daphnia magna]|uniref:Uncharacterized protein n=1 Tax=Daphnia magna TaxID=35525 RepID=A0ABR0AK80_9CRUS|nr:hypothetical protein OUZ56_014589 [Daphnia magna]
MKANHNKEATGVADERQTEVFHEKQVDSRFHVELSVLNFGVLATAVNVTRIYNRQEQLCSCGQIL